MPDANNSRKDLSASKKDTAELLGVALALHQSNRLDEAGTLYRSILKARTDHADALHLLGVIAQQRGRPENAVELIERAVKISPKEPLYHANLAEAYRASGNLQAAVATGKRALELEPRRAETFNNLGLALKESGQAAEALEHFETAIELNPFMPVSYENAGDLLFAGGRLYEALAIVREGLRLMPEAPKLMMSLDRIRQEIMRLETPE